MLMVLEVIVLFRSWRLSVSICPVIQADATRIQRKVICNKRRQILLAKSYIATTAVTKMDTYSRINQSSHSRAEMTGTSNTWYHHDHTPDGSQKIKSKRRIQVDVIEAERPDRKPTSWLPEPDTGVDPAIDAIVPAG